jgi:hypothetical protein
LVVVFEETQCSVGAVELRVCARACDVGDLVHVPVDRRAEPAAAPARFECRPRARARHAGTSGEIERELIIYHDATFAGDPIDSSSIAAFVVFLNGVRPSPPHGAAALGRSCS